MKQSTDTCASCARFDLAASMANGGRGPCLGYDRETAWNTPATVLHNPAPDRRARATLVKQLIAAQQPKREEDGKTDA